MGHYLHQTVPLIRISATTDRSGRVDFNRPQALHDIGGNTPDKGPTPPTHSRHPCVVQHMTSLSCDGRPSRSLCPPANFGMICRKRLVAFSSIRSIALPIMMEIQMSSHVRRLSWPLTTSTRRDCSSLVKIRIDGCNTFMSLKVLLAQSGASIDVMYFEENCGS